MTNTHTKTDADTHRSHPEPLDKSFRPLTVASLEGQLWNHPELTPHRLPPAPALGPSFRQERVLPERAQAPGAPKTLLEEQHRPEPGPRDFGSTWWAGAPFNEILSPQPLSWNFCRVSQTISLLSGH